MRSWKAGAGTELDSSVSWTMLGSCCASVYDALGLTLLQLANNIRLPTDPCPTTTTSGYNSNLPNCMLRIGNMANRNVLLNLPFHQQLLQQKLSTQKMVCHTIVPNCKTPLRSITHSFKYRTNGIAPQSGLIVGKAHDCRPQTTSTPIAT